MKINIKFSSNFPKKGIMFVFAARKLKKEKKIYEVLRGKRK